MYNQFKNYLNGQIGISLLGIILGTILVIYPKTSMDIIASTIACILIIMGILGVINDNKNKVVVNSFSITSKVILIVIGFVLFFNREIIESIIPIVLGIAFTVSGIQKIRYALLLKSIKQDWIAPLVASFITTFIGIIMIVNPVGTGASLTLFIGVMIIVYSISNITDTIILKRKAEDFKNYFSNLVK